MSSAFAKLIEPLKQTAGLQHSKQILLRCSFICQRSHHQFCFKKRQRKSPTGKRDL